ncbi:MAG: NAD(P)H-hydrate epimerase [Candidatus Omnitrophota bacterium]
MRTVSAEDIRKIDLAAQTTYRIPSIILMENAGICVCGEIIKYSNGRLAGRPVTVLCGRGNNGGDGFVVARHLKCMGARVKVMLFSRIKEVRKADALMNLIPLGRMKVPVEEIYSVKTARAAQRKFGPGVVVDAIFGTGFTGALPEPVMTVVDAVNRRRARVFCVDVPSGLDATTGMVENGCVKGDVTITFGLAKKGLFINSGPSHAGRVIVRNISYPRELLLS